MLRSLIAAIVIGFSTPAAVQAIEVQIDQSFDGFQFDWDRTGAMMIRFAPVMHEGEMHVCGAYSNWGGAIITRLGRQVMREARITMNGQFIMQNLQFFSIVSNRHRDNWLDGQMANCVNTGLTPSDQDLKTFDIYIRDGRYSVSR